METVNERLRDGAISHAVDLHQYSNGVVRRLIALLNRTDADLFAQLTAALDRLPAESFTTERLEQMLFAVRALNAQAYGSLGEQLAVTLRAFVAYEVGFQSQAMESAFPLAVRGSVTFATVTPEVVYAGAMARPFQGVLLREALAGLEAGRAKSIRDAIRIGYVESQTVPQIVQRLRGTRAKGYADGLFEAPRRHLEAITRTAISHTAAFTRERFHEANKSLIKALQWTSTLDSRTSEICILRDGKQYSPEAHKPMGHQLPWLGGPGAAHWQCRSTSLPVTKSWRELGIDLPEKAASTRASMDGQVSADTTYGDWLNRQSAARQDEVLGATRGKLLRDGGLTVEKFANEKGRWLTLEELRARDAKAFERAGV